jgi:hypothetical protein
MIDQRINIGITEDTRDVLDPRVRVLLLAIRQALLIALGAIEDYLYLDRSITPKHRRSP